MIRVPAILGFWLMGLGLFVFVTRRTSPLIGALALLFPLAAPTQHYAVQDYWPAVRRMERAGIVGDRPF